MHSYICTYVMKIYSTTQFKLDIQMYALVQLLKKFVTKLVSFLPVHDLWHAFNPSDEPYTREVCLGEVYFTCEQSRYV